jgi:hypothetical protein
MLERRRRMGQREGGSVVSWQWRRKWVARARVAVRWAEWRRDRRWGGWSGGGG